MVCVVGNDQTVTEAASNMRPNGLDPTGFPARLAGRLLALPAAVQFGIWFALILLVKWDALLEPPVWDSAMGVFPPAIYLYNTGFDIHELLQQGNWWQGGPNVHSLSLFTWFVAAVMTLTHSATATFAIVHLTTFAMVAYALVLFSGALHRDGVSPWAVLAGTSLLICLPIVAVQIGYLYTETWVMVFSVAAWAHWREDRIATAILFGTLVLFVKLTGLAIAACLGVALVLSLATGRTAGKRLLLLPVLPLALLCVRQLPHWLDKVQGSVGWGGNEMMLRMLFDRLGAIPDVTLLLVIGMSCSLLYGGHRLWKGAGLRALVTTDATITGRFICLAMPFVYSAGILQSVYQQNLFLPRYLVPAIPFAIAAILLFAHAIRRERWIAWFFVVACLLGVLNWNGRFYTPEYGSFSLVERSHAYQDFHRVQTELIDLIAEAPERLPIFVSREIDYMISDPMMGYVEREMPHVQALYLPENQNRAMDEYPSEFLLAHSNPGHGGSVAARLLREAQGRPDIELLSHAFEHNGFHATLYIVRRIPTVQKADRPD